MDLPFAVDSPDQSRTGLHQSASSLVTASTQGSFLPPRSENSLFSHDLAQYARKENTGVIVKESTYPGETEIVDFVHVSEVDDDEVEIVIDGGLPPADEFQYRKGEVLNWLLSGNIQNDGVGSIVRKCEDAHRASFMALESKRKGDFTAALNFHTQSAKAFRDAAAATRELDVSLSNSLLLLSQTQARSALALKRSLKQNPESSKYSKSQKMPPMSQRDRIRATVRGALVTKKEEDISNSVFLGTAISGPPMQRKDLAAAPDTSQVIANADPTQSSNPVDEMMELERELREMDMALESSKLGSSIASLAGRAQNRLKQSTLEEGSFMVVPPGSSYMSSSTWAPGNAAPTNTRQTTTGTGRARANRVQNMLEASSAAGAAGAAIVPSPLQPGMPRSTSHGSGLESSWWGNQSTASHMLASSVMSISSKAAGDNSGDQPASNKQVMKLMETLKTLGDENAILLRDAEGAEEARLEAKAMREQMARFRDEYKKRFSSLKSALEKFRKGYPANVGSGEANPVINSEFARSASTSEQLQRQEQLVRKLTADLKREKEESKKKDVALKKYETFYKEVKLRSAQKAAQRQKEATQQTQKSPKAATVQGSS